jgi:hypothetical protein
MEEHRPPTQRDTEQRAQERVGILHACLVIAASAARQATTLAESEAVSLEVAHGMRLPSELVVQYLRLFFVQET